MPAHALAPFLPEPSIGAAVWSSGQRGRATTGASAWPAAMRSIPAQAIIAALSVQSAKGGATNSKPSAAGSDWRSPSR